MDLRVTIQFMMYNLKILNNNDGLILSYDKQQNNLETILFFYIIS